MTETTAKSYSVRPYEPRDRDSVLALYTEVFGEQPEGWFDWKYLDTPATDEPVIFVAEEGDELIGARPTLPLEMQVGAERRLAVVLVNPMVHPDHRRRGIFNQMAEYSREHLAERAPSIAIGFPGEAVKDALVKRHSTFALDVGVVAPTPSYFRIQNPGALAATKTDDERFRTLARASAPLATGYLALRDAFASSSDTLTVRRHADPPIDALVSLADDHSREMVRVARDETFYRWRFADPSYEYATYTARRGDRLLAAVVVGQPTVRTVSARNVHVTETLPLDGGDRQQANALSHLLGRVASDYADADLLMAAGTTMPERLLRSRGFHSNTSLPLSMVTESGYLVARPLTDAEVRDWTIGGVDASNPENWQYSYCLREVG
jgi:hypothetical protein